MLSQHVPWRVLLTVPQSVLQLYALLPLGQPAIMGMPLSRERVCNSFGPLHLQIGLLHTESIYFLILKKSTADIIIGRPWLIKYHPVLSWSRGEVMGWGGGLLS